MAVIQFAGESEGNSNGPPRQGTFSTPAKRQRWATQRLDASSGAKKRLSVRDRFRKQSSPREEKPGPAAGTAAEEEKAAQAPPRRIYFNVPIPDTERDEDGNLKARYPRNKVRTAKYTPLTFVPKNLWLQFHNVANIYFLLVVILGVRVLLSLLSDGRCPVLILMPFAVLSHLWCRQSGHELRALDCHPCGHRGQGCHRRLATNNLGYGTKQLADIPAR